MAARDWVVERIKRVYERYGFVQIDTPVLEHLDTLLGTGGEETNKELFRLESPEEEPVAMRFDLTVPFARILAQYRSGALYEIELLLSNGERLAVEGETMESVWRLLRAASDGHCPQVFVHKDSAQRPQPTEPMQHPDIEATSTTQADEQPVAEPVAAQAQPTVNVGNPPLKGPRR